MLPRLILGFILALTGLLHAGTASLANEGPLAALVPSQDGASACFRRSYDAAHLRAHTQQQTTDIIMSSKFHGQGERGTRVERIAMQRRDGKPPLYVMMTCEWSQTANRSTSNEALIWAAKIQPGYDCILITSPGSAEEGGYIFIPAPEDTKSLTLYMKSPIAVLKGKDPRSFFGAIALSREDRVFRLAQTDKAACSKLEADLPDLP